MKLGMIVRHDMSGLAIQTWEAYQHLHPDKIMLIDVSMYANEGEDCNKFPCATHFYRDVDVHVKGWEPTIPQFEDFLDGLDAVYTAETPYGWDLVRLAQQRGVRTYVHTNPEFAEHLAIPTLIKPTLLMNPTSWLHARLPEPKRVVAFPVATERFRQRNGPCHAPAENFLHVIGRPAAYDRNGTLEVLRALSFVTQPVTLTISCLQAGYVVDCLHAVDVPDRVKINIVESQYDEYWSIYQDQDVLIQPRRWGGMSLPVQEAMAAGMPVIMSSSDVYAAQVPEEWVVQSHYVSRFQARTPIDVYGVDVQQLAERIDLFATDEVAVLRGLQAAHRWATIHSWGRLKPMYEDILSG